MQREDLLRRFRDDMGWTPSEHNLDLAETLKANISKDVADMLIRRYQSKCFNECIDVPGPRFTNIEKRCVFSCVGQLLQTQLICGQKLAEEQSIQSATWMPEFPALRQRLRDGTDDQMTIGEYIRMRKKEGVDPLAEVKQEIQQAREEFDQLSPEAQDMLRDMQS